MKIGVAFAGCACRAAFHAGVAAALEDARVPVALTAGSSSGSLVAVALAGGRGRELPSVFQELGGRSIVSFRRALHNRSLFDMSHLVRATLRARLGGGDLRAAPTEGLVVATRLRDLRPVIFSTREERDIVEPLLASCFLPVLYGRTVTLGGRLFVDGGVADNVPIAPLEERGCDTVVAVVARPDGTATKTWWRRRWRPHARAKLHVVHPRRPLPLGAWDFDRDRIARSVDEGWARGRELVAAL